MIVELPIFGVHTVILEGKVEATELLESTGDRLLDVTEHVATLAAVCTGEPFFRPFVG